jgi:hypothetical protein
MGSECSVKYLIRDRDDKYPAMFDTVADAGINVVRTGIRIPRMNAVMERWVRTCRCELLDRTLIFNPRHLLRAARVRGLLQQASASSGHCRRPAAGPATRTDY